MSKLSKFLSHLSTSKAASLLSRLIGEEVNEDTIEHLALSGWLHGYYYCNCTLVKLEQLLDPDENSRQETIGNYIVKVTEPVQESGLCFGFSYPCGTVLMDGIRDTYALEDEAGALYAMRDNETGQYLAVTSDTSFFDDFVISPDSLYELAVLANLDSPAPNIDEKIPTKNIWCTGGTFYSFGYGGGAGSVNQKAANTVERETPSSALTIAGLLDVVLDPKRKTYNQSSLISEILDRNEGIRGLSKSGLEKIFATAKRRALDAK